MSIKRRSFLAALGLGAAAPLLPSFTRRAEANDDIPKRLLIVGCRNGTHQPAYWPNHPGGPLDLSSSTILSPLADFEDKITLVKGLQHRLFAQGPGRDHVRASKQFLTGRRLLGDGEGNRAWAGESIDHAIARTLEEQLHARPTRERL